LAEAMLLRAVCRRKAAAGSSVALLGASKLLSRGQGRGEVSHSFGTELRLCWCWSFPGSGAGARENDAGNRLF